MRFGLGGKPAMAAMNPPPPVLSTGGKSASLSAGNMECAAQIRKPLLSRLKTPFGSATSRQEQEKCDNVILSADVPLSACVSKLFSALYFSTRYGYPVTALRMRAMPFTLNSDNLVAPVRTLRRCQQHGWMASRFWTKAANNWTSRHAWALSLT